MDDWVAGYLVGIITGAVFGWVFGRRQKQLSELSENQRKLVIGLTAAGVILLAVLAIIAFTTGR